MNRETIAMLNIEDQLNKYGESILIWPTGMGKTYHAFKVASTLACPKKFQTVIYLSPFNGINNDTEMKYDWNGNGIKFISFTFAKLRNINKSKSIEEVFEKYNKKSTLIVIDEAHQACAEKTMLAVKELRQICPKVKVLGLTATPIRGDRKNPIIDLFHGHVSDYYTIKEAIHDKILPKPVYICGTFEMSEGFMAEYEYLVSKARELPQKIQESITTQIQKVSMMDTEHVLSKYLPDTDYMKIIMFFPTKQILNEKVTYYKDIFQKIFPDFKINILKVYSGECQENATKIAKMHYTHNQIDIICAINMVSMGYHIDDLNILIMDRSTQSQIVYTQQLGRCFNVMKKESPLIFDFVGNCKKSQYFSQFDIKERKPSEGNELVMDKESIIFYDETVDFTSIDGLLDVSLAEVLNGFDVNQVLSQYKSGIVTKELVMELLGLTEEGLDARLLVYDSIKGGD